MINYDDLKKHLKNPEAYLDKFYDDHLEILRMTCHSRGHVGIDATPLLFKPCWWSANPFKATAGCHEYPCFPSLSGWQCSTVPPHLENWSSPAPAIPLQTVLPGPSRCLKHNRFNGAVFKTLNRHEHNATHHQPTPIYTIHAQEMMLISH